MELRIAYVGVPESGRFQSMAHVHRRLHATTPLFFRPQTQGMFAGYQVSSHVDFAVTTRALRLSVAGETNRYRDDAARDAIIESAHAFVLVVDSLEERFDENIDFVDFFEPLVAQRPVVVQLNKRDHPKALAVERLRGFSRFGGPIFATVAHSGENVWDAFEAVATLGAHARGCEPELRALLADACA